MAGTRLLLMRFRSDAPNSIRFFSSSAALIQGPWSHITDESGVSDGESAVYKRALKLQPPNTIKYEWSLINSMSLIGRIERPFTPCNSNRFGVHTVLRNNALRPYRSFSIKLIFWDEMAEMSVQHMKLNDFVYVSGDLKSYMKTDEHGKLIHLYKVNVKEVNFVSQKVLAPVSQSLVKFEPEVSYEDIKQKRRDRLHLWQIFFASPYEWWDNRNRKLNPKHPDFKHKDTGEALWLSSNDPPWVHKQLQLHDSRLYRRSSGDRTHLSPLVYE